MGLSKKTRIQIFLAVDVAFFFLEIIIGFTVHSLSLVADAFHMLNDVISLLVGLWAVHVATNRGSSNTYTYGWARAELIGGLINGVFLVALCLSIFLQAIQRFFEPQEVTRPVLVLVVGGIGFAFNVLGLFLFHQHDHGHGHGHSHGHGEETCGTAHDELGNAEQGHSDHSHSHKQSTDHAEHERHSNVSWNIAPKLALPGQRSPSGHRNSVNGRRSRAHSSVDDIPVHPASLRNDILNHARMGSSDTEDTASQSEDESAVMDDQRAPTEVSPLIKKDSKNKSRRKKSHRRSQHSKSQLDGAIVSHKDHKHNKPKAKADGGGHGHGHSEQDQNIRAQFLHVLGDALGNVGVMVSALIIWLAKGWANRFYVDPAISLVITCIILKSAIPLVRDTAKPLLQAVPPHIDIDDIRDDIEALPGVRSCHHVHVWALTPSRLIATLDVELDFDFEGRNASRYMELAKEIKGCLNGHGIANSTIQPEFCTNAEHDHAVPRVEPDRTSSSSTVQTTIHDSRGHQNGDQLGADGTVPAHCGDRSCLLDRDNQDVDRQCCKPPSGTTTPKDDDANGHGPGNANGNAVERFRRWFGVSWARVWVWPTGRGRDLESIIDIEKGPVVVQEVIEVEDRVVAVPAQGGSRGEVYDGDDGECEKGAGPGVPFH